jgi:hypothetical protein
LTENPVLDTCYEERFQIIDGLVIKKKLENSDLFYNIALFSILLCFVTLIFEKDGKISFQKLYHVLFIVTSY